MSRPVGFALVAALWLLVVVSALGLELGLRARDRALVAANRSEQAQARSAAQAGVEHARMLLDARLDDRSRKPGRVSSEQVFDPWSDVESLGVAFDLGQSSYRVEIRDVGKRLHLNRADVDALRSLFTALRMDFGAADRLAQAIADWRDADVLRRARGAELEEYLKDAAQVLPPNRPFPDVAELRHVRGMTPQAFRTVEPYLTTTGTGRVNLNAAPLAVLLTLPGITEDVALRVLRGRRAGTRVRNVTELGLGLPADRRAAFERALPELLSRTTVETRELEVRSEGQVGGSPLVVRMEALIVRTQSGVIVTGRQAT